MVLTMRQIKSIIKYFEMFMAHQFRGIKNLLEKLQYYNETDKILEEPESKDNQVNYYLLLDEPLITDIKLPPSD